MQSFTDAWDRIETFLRSGIAGSEFTPLRLLTVITLTSVLVWVTRRVTRWFVDTVLARRGFDIGMREALGAIVRYVIVTLGALVILQSAGIDLTSLNVLVGAVGVGLGFGLQNITSISSVASFSCSNARSRLETALRLAVSLAKCGRLVHAPRRSSPMRAWR